jgi:hypothetical protein
MSAGFAGGMGDGLPLNGECCGSDNIDAEAEFECMSWGANGAWGVMESLFSTLPPLVRLLWLSLLMFELRGSPRLRMLFVRDRRPALEPDREKVLFIFSQVLGELASTLRFVVNSLVAVERSSHSKNSLLSGERC